MMSDGAVMQVDKSVSAAALEGAAAVTAPIGAGDQLLYFTSPSLTADDRAIVFIRDTDGSPNLWACDFSSGDARPLTQNRSGRLKSYVYFDGRRNDGFGKASVSLDARRGLIYYVQGVELRRVDLAGNEHTLAQLPEDESTAFTHVSADGRLLCVPTTDARALEGEFIDNKPTYDIDRRVREERLSSYLNIFDTASGEQVAREQVEGAWITHVQFSPTNARVILYNHEWASECGIRRIWLWDGKSHRRIRGEGDIGRASLPASQIVGDGRSAGAVSARGSAGASLSRRRGDWVCHEMFSRDGRSIIYHGRYAGSDPVTDGGRLVFGGGNGASFIGRCNADGSDMIEIALPEDFTRYGHFTAGNDGWLVTDGYYEAPDDPPGEQGAWISLLKPDWARGTINWRPICRHGSSWKSQDEHPHPVFDHAGRNVFFTSDASGRRAIYRAST